MPSFNVRLCLARGQRGRGGVASSVLAFFMMSIVLISAPAAAEQQPAPALNNGAPSSVAKIDYNTARFERRLTAVRSTGPIKLDGALDEPDWETAPIATHFIQNDPREGQPADLRHRGARALRRRRDLLRRLRKGR